MERRARRSRGPDAAAARALRQRMTPAEARLWEAFRDRKLDGLKFRRQQPFGPFIVDFICLEARLCVEMDGAIHDEQVDQDAYRTEYISSFGFQVLRLRNDDVLRNLNAALERIRVATRNPAS